MESQSQQGWWQAGKLELWHEIMTVKPKKHYKNKDKGIYPRKIQLGNWQGFTIGRAVYKKREGCRVCEV